MTRHTRTIHVAGRDITLETGKIARQAGGAVTVRSGDTILLATACRGSIPSEDTDFLPLRVDYQEKFSSTGKTLGGFIKREGRPTEREVLTSRLIDRPLRPMFEEGYYNDTQVLAYVYSYDGVHAADALAITAASAALVISDIPLVKPIGGVRVGMVDGRFIVNPTVQEMAKSRLDLMIAGTEDAILMIEGYADFLSEEQILEAIAEGHNAIKAICEGLLDWQKEIGKPKFRDDLKHLPADLSNEVEKLIGNDIKAALHIREKQKRGDAISAAKDKVMGHFLPEGVTPKYPKMFVQMAFKNINAKLMREVILNENRRVDGRTCDQVRPIDIEMGLLPRTHGSSLFTRGETQSIAVCTLGSEDMAQRYETLHGEASHRFYLQYFFPPFSVGEVGRMGSPGRREIGHGKLAERALSAALPTQEKFPYVIRLESNITESNGSSSMASVCGGALALMDAGVPISHPISGIAMGLILEGDRFAILSDILGDEDALGDMDFKVAGSSHGISAFQLDIKVEGITPHIMHVALMQARQGRLHILNKMMEACPKAKENVSQYAPRIETMQIKPSKIGALIGPGGKQIRAITEATGAEVNIDDNGLVSISANNGEALEKALAMVINIVSDVEIGKTYTGEIVSIVDFGCFIRIFDKEGLCHISEWDHRRVENMNQVCKVGDKVEVKVLDVTDRGKISLSRKALLPAPPRAATPPPILKPPAHAPS
ncbi:MAG: polyribonucleotide nucleotidyltransferase [Verrucomicrobia bacterium]|nr:polyribonucleotide nucleotidyltransferase [Verrucomicrobiota bacterium]